MHTTSLTRTTAIDAPPEAVLAFVADPRNLPRWAPGFAPAIRPHGAEWLIEAEGRTTSVGVHVSRESRTVDFILLDPAVAGGGAFSRVLSAGQGSEYVFS